MKGYPIKELVSSRVWDVASPPPINSIKVSGALVPKAFNRNRRRRKITIEVHRTTPNKKEPSYEECIVRILEPTSKEAAKNARKAARMRRQNVQIDDGGYSLVSAMDEDNDVDDEASVSNVDESVLDSGNDKLPSEIDTKQWKAKYKFPLKVISLKGTNKKTGVMVHIDLGKNAQTREIVFDSIPQAEDFMQVLKREIALEQRRAEEKLQGTIQDIKTFTPDEMITFLVEIVSAWDIPIGDRVTSDPYVLCYMNGQKVHKTKYISATLDPVWTIKTDSLFLLKTTAKDLFLSDGLLCLLLDFDGIGKDERLGAVTVPAKTMYDAKGERMTFKIGPPPGKTDNPPGHMAIRIRRATEYDCRFLEEYQSSIKRGLLGKKKAVRRIEEEKSEGGAGLLSSYLRRQSRTVKENGKSVVQQRVRPGPDPKRKDTTEWMTSEQIEEECMKESTEWVDAGSGDLGRVYLEILGADDLPNLDTGGRNKTDSFVTVVYEDIIVKTDVIDDCLAPRWLPWSRRAFIFHMLHSSSQIFIGLFDYDDGVNPADTHDLVGRISVDLASLRRNTVYTLKYNLYTTSRMSKRKQKGQITIRLRIEMEDERKTLLSNLDVPPAFYVNVQKRKDFRLVKQTVEGKHDMSRYSQDYIQAYLEELAALKHVLFYLEDAAFSLFLWRGTTPLRIGASTYFLPIHSLTAFLAMTLVVERPQLIPSLNFFMIGWVLLAIMDYRRRLPDVWSRSRTFSEFVFILISGKSSIPYDDIKYMENYEAAQAFVESWKRRIEEADEAAKKAYEKALAEQEEYEREMEEAGNNEGDIATQQKGVSIDPFKAVLYPVQQALAVLIRYLRQTKHILLWGESYLSFWISTICFAVAIVFAFVPWFWVLQWASRIIVWVLFGPWMKLVDIYYFERIAKMSKEEKELQEKKEIELRRQANQVKLSAIRVRNENAQKLKQMKKYMFGKFITAIPVIKEDRFRDVPLPESIAVPYRPQALPMAEVAMSEAGYHKTRMTGQHLVGDMIPKIEELALTDAPKGQAVGHLHLVSKDDPAAPVRSGPETNTSAYAKIATILILSGIITWYAVPLLTKIADKLVGYTLSDHGEL